MVRRHNFCERGRWLGCQNLRHPKLQGPNFVDPQSSWRQYIQHRAQLIRHEHFSKWRTGRVNQIMRQKKLEAELPFIGVPLRRNLTPEIRAVLTKHTGQLRERQEAVHLGYLQVRDYSVVGRCERRAWGVAVYTYGTSKLHPRLLVRHLWNAVYDGFGCWW